MKIAFLLPTYIFPCGGVMQTINLCKAFQDKGHEASIHFQRFHSLIPILPVPWTATPSAFPKCDIGITYSDDPQCATFNFLPQVNRKFILMLGYGMCLPRERPNVLEMPNIKVLCSSERTRKMIEADGGKAVNVGHGFEDVPFWNTSLCFTKRKPYIAVLYHYAPDKNYQVAAQVASKLIRLKLAEGIISFGTSKDYTNAFHPEYLVKHYENATKEQVKEVFTQCQLYIMPSKTEGFNLTPIEATLCGCPSVICDGDIGGCLNQNETCYVAPCDADSVFNESARYLRELKNNPSYGQLVSDTFRENLVYLLKTETYEKVVERILAQC